MKVNVFYLDNVLENKNNCQFYNTNKPDHIQQFFIDLRNYQEGSDATLDEFMKDYGFLNLTNERFFVFEIEFPIDIKLPKKDNSKTNLLETDENILKELLRLVHGCYDKKSDLINKFNSRFFMIKKLPEHTKNSN